MNNISLDWVKEDSDLTILSLNIASMRAHFEELIIFLEKLNQLPDILTLCEVRVEEENEKFYEIKGYQKPFTQFRKDNKPGGLMIYVSNKLVCKKLTQFLLPSAESLFIEVFRNGSTGTTSNNKKLIIGNIYRHPSVPNIKRIHLRS